MTYETETESRFSFDSRQKSAFRTAITAAPQWGSYRLNTGKSAADLKVSEMLDLAQQWGINPALYGTAKGGPKPLVYGAETFHKLSTALADLAHRIPSAQWTRANDILTTCRNRQDSRMTQGQFKAVEKIILEYTTPEAPTPAPMPWETPKAAEAPKPAPVPAPPAPAKDEGREIAETIAAAVAGVLASRGTGTDEARVIELIKAHGGRPAHVTFDLRAPALPEKKGEGLFHYRFPLLLSAVNAGVNVMLVGGAGSGKTTAAEQVAEILGLPFYFTGAIDSAYKLSGFIDAQGRIVSTAFRTAYELGGVFLFDEMDASLAGAVLAFNAALANGQADFPDGMVKRHPNFRAIAATNTFGRGADRQYVGRLQLDAASLDRFACLSWDYDSAMEAALIGAPTPEGAPAPASILPMADPAAIQRESNRWIERVREVRAKAEAQKVRHIVSPRATVMGAKLLAAGWQWKEAEESCLFKGLDSDSRAKIQ